MENIFQRIEKILDDSVVTSFEDGEWQVRVTEKGVPLVSKFPSEDAARQFAAREEARLNVLKAN